jgi:hypothetical protein
VPLSEIDLIISRLILLHQSRGVMVRLFLGTALIGTIASVALPANAQVCTPLRAIGANGTQVQKKVSVPGAGVIARNNWNTDFAIPSGGAYRYYVATINPRNGGTYTVQMALKYPNDTADKVYDQKLELPQGRPLNITGSSRIAGKPYQVNVSVGGVEAVGSTYTVAASGCR